jgi:glycosyltransferase involved in cell wall biosynthesis
MTTNSAENQRVSIIVPAYNAAEMLPRCLDALVSQASADVEILVVDDGSTDATASAARHPEVRLITFPRRAGAAAARNAGASAAVGEVLLFVDADVVIAPRTLVRVRSYLGTHPQCAALFGSYDTRPDAAGVVSQYRNLLHHFVHQRANPRPSHFWSGLGAIRRDAFIAVGGFDESMSGIEDVELGYRLRRAGHEIHLDPTLQATHLKRWTLWSMLRTDIGSRALPWTWLLLNARELPGDFSLDWRARTSVVIAWLSLSAIALAPVNPWLMTALMVLLPAFLATNADLMIFFRRQRGWRFMLAAMALHLLYSFSCGAGLLLGLLLYILSPGARKAGGKMGGARAGS